MANVIINDSNLTAIGNAIRSKNGETTLYKPREMAAAIEAIQTGGGSSGGGDDALRAGLVGVLNNAENVNFVVPAGATYIPMHFLRNQPGLATITFEDPSKMNYIDSYAFAYSENFTVDALPSSLWNIGNSAFYDCYNLALKEFPSNLQSIDQYAFFDCYKLEADEIPEGVTTIGAQAFNYAYQTNPPAMLTLPASLETIGQGAFQNTFLKAIRFKGTPKSINKYTFNNSRIYDIYVPWGSGEIISDVTTSAPWGATSATIHYNVSPDEVIA